MSDPGNPRKRVLSPVEIFPAEGELAEFSVSLNGKPNKMVVDAVDEEDAIWICQQYLDYVGIDYEVSDPVRTGGKVNWTGKRRKR